MTSRLCLIMAALVLTAAAANAGWRDEATRFDAQRLARLSESRAKGMDEARGGSPSDLAAIQSIMGVQPVAATPGALAGNWRCRTMKLGGVAPEIVYSWFHCRISERGGALFLEKLTGSNRTSGTLYGEGGGFVYLGASYVVGYGESEKPHAYSGNGAEVGAGATPDDQIGLLSLLADGRARLEMPYPVQESTFDVLELKR